MNTFQAAAIFGITPHGHMLLLRVDPDFDCARQNMIKQFGKSLPNTNLVARNSQLTEGTKVWVIDSHSKYEEIFSTFFRPYKNSQDIKKKPEIFQLAVSPINIGQPIVANDFLEHE